MWRQLLAERLVKNVDGSDDSNEVGGQPIARHNHAVRLLQQADYREGEMG